jgi:hypothetical protein
MNQNKDFGYKVRQILNDGTDLLDEDVVTRLHKSRQIALNSQQVRISGMRVAGVSGIFESAIAPWLRHGLAILALLLGAVGTYYWNSFQDAQEFEEIDSALLADELPPSAYLDRGFQAWLEHATHSSPR